MINKLSNLFANTNHRFLFISVSLIASMIYFPWMIFVGAGIFARCAFKENIGRQFLTWSLIGFLSLFNATKRIDGDWAWYVAGYLELTRVGLFDYLKIGGLSIRITEPIYYSFSFILSRLSDGNILILTLAVSLAIYYTYVFALERLLKRYGMQRMAVAICIVFAVLAGLTFTQSTHLVRQYIAGSILFLYFVLLVERCYKKSAILYVLGTFVHNSFIVPASLLILCTFVFNFSFVQKRFVSVIFSFIGAGYVFGTLVPYLLIGTARETSAFMDDGSVSSIVLLMDFLFFLSTVTGVVCLRSSPVFSTKSSAVAALFLALFGGMLVGARELPLFYLRFYFYIEWFRVIGVITIVWFLIYRLRSPKVAFLIIPLSFIMISLRVEQSPWNYGGGVFSHLFGSAVWWVNELAYAAR